MKKNKKVGIIIAFSILPILVNINRVMGVVSNIITIITGFDDVKKIIIKQVGRWFSFDELIHIFILTLLLGLSLLAVYLFVKHSQKRKKESAMAMSMTWFNASSRATDYSGGEEYFYQLKTFLNQTDASFLWWAVAGVAGIGKTRLISELLRIDDFQNADVHWIQSFEQYRKNSLTKCVDDLLGIPNLNNIIIAEDAQLYMENISELIEYITDKDINDIGDHKIKLLLLIRMGEDEDLRDRYHQLSSRASHYILEKTRFSKFGNELIISKYSEDDVNQIVKSYIKKNRKVLGKAPLDDEHILDIQKKVTHTLKIDGMDPDHLRPLFAMFITDALIEGKEPMSWDRKRILEYVVVERGEKLLQYEARNLQVPYNRHILEKLTGIISLSIIRSGISLAELETIGNELKEELRASGLYIKDFLKDLQMLADDGMIRVSMPDLISEYYVLRRLVINPDEEPTSWIIHLLISHITGGIGFREKVRQDFKYLYSDQEVEDGLDCFYYDLFEQCNDEQLLAIINHILIEEKDISDSNIIIIHEAISKLLLQAKMDYLLDVCNNLLSIIENTSDVQQLFDGIREFERLSEVYCKNIEIMRRYVVILNKHSLSSSNLDDKKECIEIIRPLVERNPEDLILSLYFGFALYDALCNSSDAQERWKYLLLLNELSKKARPSGFEHSPKITLEEIIVLYLYYNALLDVNNDTIDLEERDFCSSEIKKLMPMLPDTFKNPLNENRSYDICHIYEGMVSNNGITKL